MSGVVKRVHYHPAPPRSPAVATARTTARTADRLPAYRLHRPSGRAVVRLSGEDHYLGPHGTAESQAAYHRVVAEWLGRGKRPRPKPTGITVSELWAHYEEHARSWYVKGGARDQPAVDRPGRREG